MKGVLYKLLYPSILVGLVSMTLIPLNAQAPMRGVMPTGRLYGKIVDENGNGVSYATVQLFKTLSGENKEETGGWITGQITEENGDFSLEDIPAGDEF